MSGGRHTVARKQGRSAHASAGDISSIHPCSAPLLERYVIEAKHYRDLKMHSLLVLLESACLRVFWNTVCEVAHDADKRALLIGKEHNLPAFVLIEWPSATDLDLDNHVIAAYPPLKCDLVWWDDFLRYARPPK